MNFAKTFIACVLAFVVGSFLFLFIWLMMVIGLVGSMGKSKPLVEEESILKIDFAEVITDSPSTDPLAGIDLMSMQSTKQMSLMDAMRAIEAATDDDRIKGIYLRMNLLGGAMDTAVLEELRSEIELFKESGKFVVAYNESYSQGLYYLASVADKIYLQPEGSMDWSGLSASLMFYKGLIDKLDLNVEILRPTSCRFKSAVEPYMYEKMSPENRLQMQAMVDGMWKTICEAVSASRGISVEELNRIADDLLVMLPNEALEHKLIDGVLYEDQMSDVFTELGVEKFDDKHRMISLGDYSAAVPAPTYAFGAPEVAIVYAEGQIVDGEGTGAQIYGNTLAANIQKVREDENVKAVVLRVNSPGGSALASDVIWREVELLKAEKPVIVSMGAYAASGGYYISCPADVIVSDKMTLTGSIGVFGMMLNPYEALEKKLGITVDGVKSNKQAGMGTTAPLTRSEKAAVMRGVDRVYTTFTGNVSEGRNLPIERVLELAEGRVWSGVEALERGLVDANGGLRTAIAIAADKAELGEDYAVVEKVESSTGFAAIFSALSGSVKASWEASELGLMMREYRAVQELLNQRGVVMYSPYKVVIE